MQSPPSWGTFGSLYTMVRWLTMGVYSGVWAGRRSTRTSPRASLWIQVQKMLRPPFRAIVQRCLITILLAGFTLAREDQQEEHGLWRHLQGILGTISSFVGGGGVSSQSVATPVAIGQTGTTKTSVPLPTAPKSTGELRMISSIGHTGLAGTPSHNRMTCYRNALWS